MKIDREELRRSREALRASIAERQAQLDVDPRVTVRTATPLVYKTTTNVRSTLPENIVPNENDFPTVTDAPPFTEEQLDIISAVLGETRAELRAEMRAEFASRVAKLEGQITALLTLLSGDNNKSGVTPLRLTTDNTRKRSWGETRRMLEQGSK